MSAVARRFHEHGLGSRTGLRIGAVARDEHGAEDLDAFFAESKRVLDGLDDLHGEFSVEDAGPVAAGDEAAAAAVDAPPPPPPSAPASSAASPAASPSPARPHARPVRVSDFPRAPDLSLWDSTVDISREKTFDLTAGDQPSDVGAWADATVRASPAPDHSLVRPLRPTSRSPTPLSDSVHLSRVDDTLPVPDSDVPSFLRPDASTSRVDLSQLMYGDAESWEESEVRDVSVPVAPSPAPALSPAPAPASLDASQDGGSELAFDPMLEPDTHSLRATPEVEVMPVPKKRGRGRPRKSETLRAAAAAAAAGIVVPRRGPGRPPGRQLAPQRIVEKVYDPPAWQINEHGLRRGRRHRIRPLDWWRGERALYGRDGMGADADRPLMPFGLVAPVLREVIRVPRAPGEGTFSGMRRAKTQPGTYAHPGRPLGSRNFASSQAEREAPARTPHPEDGWDEATDPVGRVYDTEQGAEVPMRIACPADAIRPRPAFNQRFAYEKLFGVGDFMAAGVLVIPVDGDKPTKPSKDNSYAFVVLEGAVQVMVHRTSFVIAPGGMFLVPKGNMYNIRNVAQREARIFFAQARSVSAPLTPVMHGGRTVFSHTEEGVERAPRGRPRKNVQAADEGEEEDAEEEDEEEEEDEDFASGDDDGDDSASSTYEGM